MPSVLVIDDIPANFQDSLFVFDQEILRQVYSIAEERQLLPKQPTCLCAVDFQPNSFYEVEIVQDIFHSFRALDCFFPDEAEEVAVLPKQPFKRDCLSRYRGKIAQMLVVDLHPIQADLLHAGRLQFSVEFPLPETLLVD